LRLFLGPDSVYWSLPQEYWWPQFAPYLGILAFVIFLGLSTKLFDRPFQPNWEEAFEEIAPDATAEIKKEEEELDEHVWKKRFYALLDLW
jgi:hypothetical protein